jgi:SHS2 domain-containing protein
MKACKQEGFKEVEHTGDLALNVWANSEEEIFRQAVLGMTSLMGAERGSGKRSKQDFTIRATDRESMLVQFLNRILLEMELKKTLPDIIELSFDRLRMKARLTYQPLANVKKMIKAATYHDLRILHDGATFSTTIVFDV